MTIQDVIDNYLSKRTRMASDHKLRLFPSQASVYVNNGLYKKLEGKCLRAAFYSCQGLLEKTSLPTSKKVLSKLGDYVERMIADLLKDSESLIDRNIKFDIQKYNISGKIDCIIKIDGINLGLEIKSIGSSKWVTSSIFGSQWQKPTPRMKDVLQTLIYLYALQEKVQEFILLYIRRDTCEIKEFRISMVSDGDLMYPSINGIVDYRYTINDILARYSLLMSYIEKQETPPRDYVKIYPKEIIPKLARLNILTKKQVEQYNESPFGDIECKLCGYADMCDKEI